MKRLLFRHFYKLAFCSDLSAVRFLLAIAAIFVGLGFLWPSTVFPDPSVTMDSLDLSRKAYIYMAAIAPEWLWGAFFTLQGFAALRTAVSRFPSKFYLWVDAVLGCFLWSTATIACYLVYWPGVGNILDYRMPAILGGDLAIMAASWWLLVRYGYEEHHDRG